LRLDLYVNHIEQAAVDVEPDYRIAGVVVPGRIGKDEQWVREDGDGLFEGYAVDTPVSRCLGLIPDEEVSVQFLVDVHLGYASGRIAFVNT